MSYQSEDSQPFPVGDSSQTDLSGIVTNLNRARARSRNKLANDELTRAFLDAALSLTEDLFSAPVKDADEERPTMSYLSKPKIVGRVRRDSKHLAPTEAKFRDRWAAHQNFLADFISYALTARHWSLHIALAKRSEELLTSGQDFAKSVHEIAYADLMLVLDLPAYRFQLLAVASSAADSVASKALSSMYASLAQAWGRLYVKVFDHYGVRFRPGVSVEAFNIILQSTAEGLGMRLVAGVNEPILNHEEKSSLLGTAAMALLIGFLDLGDGMSVDELAEHALTQFKETTSG